MTDTTLVESDAVALLTHGSLELEGRLLDASNTTLRAVVTHDGVTARCVYKPVQGERPLWDFPDGTLAGREVSAYLVSRATGWGLVPPTILRDGPFGEGMVQLWIDVDQEADVIEMVLEPDPRLRRIALFDAIVNNTDRKGGHLLPIPGGHVFGVDQGVCFSPVPKLRTVLWGWRGTPIEAEELAVVRSVREALDGSLGDVLAGLLEPVEVSATKRRTDRLLDSRRFPMPSPTWPAVPWPPF